MFLIGLLACGDSAGPGHGPVASVAIVSGDLQRGPAGVELPDPLVVRVLDAEGDPVSGQVVNFRVVAGEGSVFAGSGSSNPDGLVQERWILGPVLSDTQRVEARAVDPATGEPIVFAVFRAVATPAPGGALQVQLPLGPDVPQMIVGQAFLHPIVVLAYDGFGHPVAGVEVSFAVTGGGTVSSSTAVTGDDGRAFLERWTMGPTPGLNSLTASAPGYQSGTAEALAITRASLEIIPGASDLIVDSMVPLGVAQLDAEGDTVPNPSVQFRSLDPGVATVSTGGMVTGVATGQARIVAEAGELADTAEMTVAMGFTAVSAGWSATCAIRVGGEGRCWGSDQEGQLGDGPANSSGTASVAVAGNLRFEQIATSLDFTGGFTCGLTTAGSVYCWGENSVGQLGSAGPSTDAPRAVSGGLTFKVLSVGREHACAVDVSGKAYCWGANEEGQLGTGDSTARSQPTAVAGNPTFTTLGAGHAHTCGVTAAGAAYCWGSGEAGRLGHGTEESSPVPVPVAGGHLFTSVAAAGRHSCGLTTTSDAYCWGNNRLGQIGDGHFFLDNVLLPSLVVGGKSWTAITAGRSNSCGIADDGSGYCWGVSAPPGLGSGGAGEGNPESTPQLVLGSHRFSSISIGGQICGVTTRPGSPLFCWGFRPRLVTGF